jgi:hypothetical protein
MTIERTAGCLILFVLLGNSIGCGGGGGSGVTAALPSGSSPVETGNPDPGGMWSEATIIIQSSDSVDWPELEIVGVSISSGEMRFLDEQGASYVAQVDTKRFRLGTDTWQDFSGQATIFSSPGSEFETGSTVMKGTMQGFISNGFFDAYIYPDGGDFRHISAAYDDLYERNSSLALVSGTWEDASGNTYSIDAAGVMFGQDSSGCVYDGTVSIIDTNFDVYRISITVANCAGVDGTYRGLGVINDFIDAGDNGLLVFNGNDGDVAVLNRVFQKLSGG